VLEPSTGSGVFVRSALYRLRELLQVAPQKQIWACDIDEAACAQTIESARLPASHVFHGDFFRLIEEKFFQTHRFDCVIGNPPYVSLHRMDAAQRSTSRKAIEKLGLKLDRKASLWAYFLAVGVELINPGGRLAFIIPEISLHADYARTLLPLIAKKFRKCFAISLRERCFTIDGAEERIVLLLGDHAEVGTSGDVIINECDTVYQLEAFLRSIITDNSDSFPRMNGHIVPHLLQAPRKTSIDLMALPHSCKLGSLADVKIGVVTGANKFFLLTETERQNAGIPPSAVVSIIPDFKACQGISFTKWDWNRLLEDDEKCWLLAPKPREHRKGVLKYLQKWDQSQIDQNKTFQKRQPW
jgi:adenine-specific DNA methylase